MRERHPGEPLTVVECDLENAVLLHNAFDIAVAATSWHWIDATAALHPEGGLAIWWTVFGPTNQPQTEFRARLETLYSRYLPGERDNGLPSKAMRIDEWKEQLQIGGWFAAPDVEKIPWSQHLTPDSAQALWTTFPNLAELPEEERTGLLNGVGAAVESLGGTVADPRLTIVHYTRRTGSA